MMTLLRVALATAAFLIAGPAAGHALVLFDNFGGPGIDPNKWSGFESESGADTEVGRRLTLGSVRINYTSFGGNTSDTGRPGGTLGLSARNPNAITAMQADMVFLEATAQGCPANSQTARARMQILGDFFNDGSGDPAAGDRTGNYRVGIQKVLDSGQGRRIEAFVNRCTDPACSVAGQVSVATDVFAASWAPFVKTTLRVEWEPWSSQFVFTVNPGRRQEQLALGYDVDTVEPAVLPFKNIDVSNSMPNCTAGRRRATSDGLFDNVMTNPVH